MNFTPLVRPFFEMRARRTEKWASASDSVQQRQLAYLLRRGAATHYLQRYGSPRSYSEFAQRVPVVEYEDVRADIERMLRGEKNVLWPGRCSNFAQSSGTSGSKSKYIPITADSLRINHYSGTSDSVAHYLNTHPHSRVFSGPSLILGGSFANELDAAHLAPGIRVGDLSATLIDRMPRWATRFRVPRPEVALMADWAEKLPALAEEAARADVVSLSGVPSWMLTVLRRVMEITGADVITDVWPHLEVFYHGGISFKPYRAEYEQLSGGRLCFVENYNASEGFFACQNDPADPAMLLCIDAGIFYEFMPLRGGDPVPLWQVEKGEIYELVITSCNGLWRYCPGDTVRIESTAPVKITVAGRVKSYINAFGEEVMEHNTDAAIAAACSRHACSVSNYTVAPVFAACGKKGHHQWLIEWITPPADVEAFADTLDQALQSVNSDYQAKRQHGLFLDRAEVLTMPAGTFDRWLASRGSGRLGGQRKIPRLSNDRSIADSLLP